MQTVYALPGIARRWSGLTMLLAIAATVTFVRLSTLSPSGLGMGGAHIASTPFYMLHPDLGWDYFGCLMNRHRGGPQPDFGGGNPLAGLIASNEDRWREDAGLEGTELAFEEEPRDNPETPGIHEYPASPAGGATPAENGGPGLMQLASGWRARGAEEKQKPVAYRVGEEFPAAYLEHVDSTKMRALFRLRKAGTESSSDPKGLTYEAYARRDPSLRIHPYPAWRLKPNPVLERLVPGVEFYLADGMYDRPYTMLATRQGKLYELPFQLGTLILDGGLRLTVEDMPAVVQVLLAVELAYRNLGGGFRSSWEARQADGATRLAVERMRGYGEQEILDGLAPLIPAHAISDLDWPPVIWSQRKHIDTLVVRFTVGSSGDSWPIQFEAYTSTKELVLRPLIWGKLPVSWVACSELDDNPEAIDLEIPGAKRTFNGPGENAWYATVRMNRAPQPVDITFNVTGLQAQGVYTLRLENNFLAGQEPIVLRLSTRKGPTGTFEWHVPAVDAASLSSQYSIALDRNMEQVYPGSHGDGW